MAKRAHKAPKTYVQAAEPRTGVDAVGSGGHYEGKVHYPKAVYGKRKDGTVVSRLVHSGAEYADLLKSEPKMNWSNSPEDHGIETAPGGSAIEDKGTPAAVAPVPVIPKADVAEKKDAAAAAAQKDAQQEAEE